MRKWIVWCLVGLPLLLLVLLGVYLIAFDGWKDVTYGRYHRVAESTFRDVSDVDEVEIYLLLGEDGTETGEFFPIKANDDLEPVHGVIALSGKGLEEFLDVWKWQSPMNDVSAMCHLPAYGFRFFENGRLVRETSMCWACSNYTVDVYPGLSGFYGFDSGSELSKQLLEFCDARLPYFRKPGDR